MDKKGGTKYMQYVGEGNLLEASFSGDLEGGLKLILKWILGMYVCGKLNWIELAQIVYSGELELWVLSERNLWGLLGSQSIRWLASCQVVLVSG
jgi:hypothetical protein